MSVRGASLLCGLLAVAVGASGCVAVAVGAGAAGTVAYLAGDLEAHQTHGIDAVYAASREALAQLEMTVIEGRTTKDALEARIVARDAADKEIVIKLKSTAGTGFTYVTRKNRRNNPDRIVLRKFDPVVRKHVDFREER